ncbi:MAG TPA: TolC family protein [Enhygromyxa sp.]|nr:TolC family protein [Enhygromyxa sp.]
MTASGLTLALACLIALGPPEGPAPAPDDHELHDSARRRLSFDESIGASEAAPIVVGFAEAAQDKRERDDAIPRLSQNPQVQLMPGARVNAGADNGFELQATITQGWSLERYGKARRAAARAETEVLDADARARALEQRFGAADAWIRLHGAELRLALARQDLAVAEQLVDSLELAREAGVATRLDVAEAEALAAAAESAVVELAGEVHDLGLALARETGVTSSSPLGTRGVYPNPELPDEAELRRSFAELDRLPAVQRRRLEARAALAEARELERSNGTVLSTGASVQLESTEELLVFGVVGATIGAIDRNQRGRASAHAQARRAEAEADQLTVELAATLAIALHELRHTRERVELLHDRTLPALDELIAARTAALELGEGTRAQLLVVQHRRNLAARELLAAEADHAWARVQIWLYLEALDAEAEAG